MMNETENSQSSERLRWLAIGTAIGAALGAISAYFLDPVEGRQRRVLTRDKIASLVNRTSEQSGKLLRNWRNRIRGRMIQSAAPINDSVDANDDTLKNRVRSKLGRVVRHARTIEVEAHNGAVILSGEALASEIEALIRCARQIPGVRSVENRLSVHRTSPAH